MTSELRLAIARTGIGLELAAPLAIDCLQVTEVAVSLPSLRFPVDVSGGVTRFRHRRGKLERLVVEATRSSLEAWAAPRLRGLVGVETPRVALLVRRHGATVGLVDARSSRCLAFELELDAEGSSIGLSVHAARGVGLVEPATALAVRATATLVAGWADRRGARFTFDRPAARLTRALFADRGARAPDTEATTWASVRGHDDLWLLIAERDGRAPEPSPSAVLARETCSLAEAADDASFALDLERARGLLIDLLERAPRHAELSRRLAEIDVCLGGAEMHGRGGRREAALATLRDARRAASDASTLITAELLRDTGDGRGAAAAFRRVGEAEPVGALASLAYEQAALLTDDPHDALATLDLAVARSPSLQGPRWSRLRRRLTAGRPEDAWADAEHLEALATGARARLDVWIRVGDSFRSEGWHRESAEAFERALRYAPKDPAALAGLGSALVGTGKATRGAELLTQALSVAESTGAEQWGAVLELAKVLAEHLGDKSGAIARARDVPSRTREAVLARGLEGRWRAELGDVAGASAAYARARELIDARLADDREPIDRGWLAVLVAGATLEGSDRGDWPAAHRYLLSAVRLAPDDAAVRGALAAAASKLKPRAQPAEEPPIASRSVESSPTWTSTALPEPEAEAEDAAPDHARADELTRKLEADPTNEAIVDELSACLMRLGRTHELFALLSARLDEATPERREALLPRHRETLRRLEDEALAADRRDEASLYRDMLDSL